METKNDKTFVNVAIVSWFPIEDIDKLKEFIISQGGTLIFIKKSLAKLYITEGTE